MLPIFCIFKELPIAITIKRKLRGAVFLETPCFFCIVFIKTLLGYFKKKITTLSWYIKILGSCSSGPL